LQLSELWSIELWRGFAMGFQTKSATRGLLFYIGNFIKSNFALKKNS
jgi:hypothetical protein